MSRALHGTQLAPIWPARYDGSAAAAYTQFTFVPVGDQQGEVSRALRFTAALLHQGDDKTLIIWRTEDWTPIARVTEPFQRWLTLAFSLRCDTVLCGTTCNLQQMHAVRIVHAWHATGC